MKRNTIPLKNYLKVYEEIEANTTITPGMLIELHTDGKVRPHDDSDDNVLPMFAVEDELQGKSIDDNYSDGDIVQCWIPQRGEVVNALLQDGEEISKGNFLVSNGNGRLKAEDPFDSTGALLPLAHHPLVGVALEDLDLTTSTGAWDDNRPRRIPVRIL